MQIALNKLETLDSSKNNFLKIISHEIRTPLNGIVGASFLLKSMADTPDKKEFFNMFELSIKRLESFSYAALQITELQTKTGQLPRQPAAINDLINEAKNISLVEQNRKVTIELKDVPGTIPVNKVLFVTALVKLFDNSIRYSPVGSQITLKVLSAPDGIMFRLMDEGAGFSEEVLLRKFELFVTGASHIDKNPGMSLPLVKFIIEGHGGKIDLYNNPSGGAVVDFIIPAV